MKNQYTLEKAMVDIINKAEYTDVSVFRFYKRNKNVTCVAKVGNDYHMNPTSALVKVGTLPESYRPPMDVQAPLLWGSYVNVTGMIQILTNGDVKLYASSGQTDVQPWVTFTYAL